MTYADPSERGIGMVFQSYALYPTMTVEKNMSFGLRIAGTPKAEIARRVARAADMLQLEPLLDRKPAQLSGGQRQRVAIGRALVREAGVFLFDEPLSNLDAKLRAELRRELKLLHQTLRSTMIYVTHDQVEAMTLATRIVVMRGGKVQQIGAPAEVYERPANLFVAGFLGAPAMNFIDGALDVHGRFARRAAVARRCGGQPAPLAPRCWACVPSISPSRAGAPLAGTVTLVEPMGNHQVVWIDCRRPRCCRRSCTTARASRRARRCASRSMRRAFRCSTRQANNVYRSSPEEDTPHGTEYRKRSRAAAADLLPLLAGASPCAPRRRIRRAGVWVTTGDQSKLLSREKDACVRRRQDARAASSRSIRAPATRRWSASARRSPTRRLADPEPARIAQQRDALLQELFGRDAGGIGLSFTRLTIGASDFSLDHYSFDDMPRGETDPTLEHFSIEAEPRRRCCRREGRAGDQPAAQVMASPWSAPGWMKTTRQPDQGHAASRKRTRRSPSTCPQVRRAYAAEGIPIFALTDAERAALRARRLSRACGSTAGARAAFIGGHLGPLLERERDHGDQILDWDHNWDEPESPLRGAGRPRRAAVRRWRRVALLRRRRHGAGAGARRASRTRTTYFTECSGGALGAELRRQSAVMHAAT